MNDQKEAKSKNHDSAELVGRELQSLYRAPSIPAPPARLQKQLQWLKMTLTLTKN
jgi:hypothetical protein